MAQAIPFIASAVASSVLSRAMTPKPPAPTEPKTMPTPDDEAIQAAKRNRMAAVQARSGRASTILSGDYSQKLGG